MCGFQILVAHLPPLKPPSSQPRRRHRRCATQHRRRHQQPPPRSNSEEPFPLNPDGRTRKRDLHHPTSGRSSLSPTEQNQRTTLDDRPPTNAPEEEGLLSSSSPP
ncbi:unnamed protein product [Linum trigynum]|uniref:Uncharacterized protein n=1 Tax=Linum trigynum TaxID=586398 RepID=A0AAV2FGG5_9ROSI